MPSSNHHRDLLDLNNLPTHVAVIMDGNGRWAKEKGKERLYGHREGVNSVRSITEASGELGIKYLTLYAFSTENWNRPKEEVDGLMSLLVSTIRAEVDNLNENNTRLKVIGDINSLPPYCKQELEEAINLTAGNTNLTLILALSYSSKWEINKAIKQIAQDYKENKIGLNDIDDNFLSDYLTTAGIPDPELLIRTSGEHRISNFLLYQLAYAEFYFTETHWPDFGKDDFYKALSDYQSRERRFGLISEQI